MISEGSQSAGQKMAMLILLYLSCVGAEYTTQSLLRDISRCYKEVPLPSNTLWWHGMCCSAASQKLSVHFSEVSKMTGSSAS